MELNKTNSAPSDATTFVVSSNSILLLWFCLTLGSISIDVFHLWNTEVLETCMFGINMELGLKIKENNLFKTFPKIWIKSPMYQSFISVPDMFISLTPKFWKFEKMGVRNHRNFNLHVWNRKKLSSIENLVFESPYVFVLLLIPKVSVFDFP